MYTVKSDMSITVLVVPDRVKEFEHIKTIDDLVKHLKKKSDLEGFVIPQVFPDTDALK